MSTAVAVAPPVRFSLTKDSLHPPALYEGTLQKVGGSVKTWKTRYFRLYVDQLHYFESDNAALPKGSILLPGARISVYASDIFPAQPFAFGLTPTNSQRSYVMSAASHAERMMWIKVLKPLCCASIKALTGSLKEGYLTKQGGTIKTWKRRWCILTDRQLQYYKDVSHTKGSSEMIDALDLSQFEVESEKGSGSEWIFTVKPTAPGSNGRVYKFACTTDAERESWLAVLRTLKRQNQAS